MANIRCRSPVVDASKVGDAMIQRTIRQRVFEIIILHPLAERLTRKKIPLGAIGLHAFLDSAQNPGLNLRTVEFLVGQIPDGKDFVLNKGTW